MHQIEIYAISKQGISQLEYTLQQATKQHKDDNNHVMQYHDSTAMETLVTTAEASFSSGFSLIVTCKAKNTFYLFRLNGLNDVHYYFKILSATNFFDFYTCNLPF